MYPTMLIENRAKIAQLIKNAGPIFFVPTRLRSLKPLGTHGPPLSGGGNSAPSHLFHQDVTKEMKKAKELSLQLLQNVKRKTVAFFYSLPNRMHQLPAATCALVRQINEESRGGNMQQYEKVLSSVISLLLRKPSSTVLVFHRASVL